MAHIRRKEFTDQSVYDAALERIRYCYDNYDDVVVSFSGGKDSTAVMQMALIVARERNRLPLKLTFYDEEVIHPPTVEYVRRVAESPEIDLTWYCLPVKHRNACSLDSPFWYCWDPECPSLWVRELPTGKGVVRDHPLFRQGMSFQEFDNLIMNRRRYGSHVVTLQGVRSQESMNRYRMIARKKNDAFLGVINGTHCAYPIYDWSSEDVWKIIEENDFDYNRTYDVFNRTRYFNQLLKQRVCPPFGEEPLRGLWIYAECFPEMWHKMLYRVPGVATAWRYANTELYLGNKKPESMTWKQYCEVLLMNYNEGETLEQIRSTVQQAIALHFKKTTDPIEDETNHPVTGCSWKFLCKIVIRGDLKGRTLSSMSNRVRPIQSLSKNNESAAG